MRTAHDLHTGVKTVLKIGFDHMREGELGTSYKLRKSSVSGEEEYHGTGGCTVGKRLNWSITCVIQS
jgi:hypothetical protein